MNRTYFVYLIQRGQDGPVKIGYASKPASRLKILQVGCAEKLRLLRQVRCASKQHAMDVEQFLHLSFGHLRLNGEWFSASVLQTVESLRIPPPNDREPRKYISGKLIPMYVAQHRGGVLEVKNMNKAPRPTRARGMQYFDDYSGTWKSMRVD